MALVTIYVGLTNVDAHFLKSVLESNGIRTLIFDDQVSSILPHLTLAAGGPRLAVLEEDEIEAKKLVDAVIKQRYFSIPSKVKQIPKSTKCPRCGNDALTVVKIPRKIISFLATLLFMFPFVLRKKYTQCDNCGAYWRISRLK